MRDFFSWSLPLGRVFGISVRVHVLLPLVAAGLILRTVFQKDVLAGTWIDMSMLLGLMFIAILLHEFGHCYAGRLMDGEANEILLWPLGGLAMVDVPQTPRANFVVAIAGPAVNLLLFVICGVLLSVVCEVRPIWNPLWYPFRSDSTGVVMLTAWSGEEMKAPNLGAIVLARFCYVNWLLFLFNMLLIGFPMDAGRMFQCILWKYVGYRQATLAAIFAGFLTALALGLVAIIWNEWLFCALGLFIFVSCWQQRVVLETGGEESLFGYDFSQGYTSLERDHPSSAAPPRRRLNWFQRWSQRRAARKLQRETEQREAEERRMDELLEKVQRHGLPALTDEERRFLKRVSDRYRNRH
jgi:Zn-dependent protease